MGSRAGKDKQDKMICISPLPRAPGFAGVLGQVKKTRIGSYVRPQPELRGRVR